MLSRYAGFQLFFLNVSYLMLLVLLLTPGEITQSILTSSLYVLMFISAILIYILRESQIDFNVPNLITNFRLVLNIFIFVCIYNTESYDIETILLLVIISLILDGADGYLSRHLNQMTLFGKTFDQEVDNFLIFILSFSLIYNYDFNIALVCNTLPLISCNFSYTVSAKTTWSLALLSTSFSNNLFIVVYSMVTSLP